MLKERDQRDPEKKKLAKSQVSELSDNRIVLARATQRSLYWSLPLLVHV